MNSAGDVDIEIVRGITRPSLRHKDQTPGAVVSRSWPRRGTGRMTEKTRSHAYNDSVSHLCSPSPRLEKIDLICRTPDFDDGWRFTIRYRVGYLAGRPAIGGTELCEPSHANKRASCQPSNHISLEATGLQASNRVAKSHRRIEGVLIAAGPGTKQAIHVRWTCHGNRAGLIRRPGFQQCRKIQRLRRRGELSTHDARSETSRGSLTCRRSLPSPPAADPETPGT